MGEFINQTFVFLIGIVCFGVIGAVIYRFLRQLVIWFKGFNWL